MGVVICQHSTYASRITRECPASCYQISFLRTFVGSGCLAVLSAAYSFICATNVDLAVS